MKSCTFKNLPRVMQCMPWKNENTAKKYPIIYNKITEDEYNAIVKQNKVISGVDAPYIIVNTRYNDYSYPDKYYFYIQRAGILIPSSFILFAYDLFFDFLIIYGVNLSFLIVDILFHVRIIFVEY